MRCICLVTFSFIRETGKTVDEEEEFIIHKNKISTWH